MIKHKKYKLFLPVNVVFIICQRAFFVKAIAQKIQIYCISCKAYWKKLLPYIHIYVCHICIFIGDNMYRYILGFQFNLWALLVKKNLHPICATSYYIRNFFVPLNHKLSFCCFFSFRVNTNIKTWAGKESLLYKM